MVSVIIPDEALKIYSPKDIFLASTKVSKDFNFEYKNNQLIVRLNKNVDSKDWIYKFTKLLGSVGEKNV